MRSFFLRALRALNHISVRLISRMDSVDSSTLEHGRAQEHRTSSEKAAIVITTFGPRFFSHAIPTIKDLREAGVTNEIFLVINGDQGGRYDIQLRDSFLKAICEFERINPICLGTGRGMAEMWNIGARLANTRHIIVLNEDLVVSKPFARDCINLLDHELKSNGLVVLNESFGHFAVTKDALIDTNWFDERFLEFGEEDGDFIWRYEKISGKKLKNVFHPGLNNVASNRGYELIVNTGESKYSKFNYEFLRVKYEFLEGPPQGSFSKSAHEKIPSPAQYPHERFRESLEALTLSLETPESLRSQMGAHLGT